MNVPAVISLPLSSMENMRMELDWRFVDLFDQLWSIREILEEVKNELARKGEFKLICNVPTSLDDYLQEP
jgi:hypothetical protein